VASECKTEQKKNILIVAFSLDVFETVSKHAGLTLLYNTAGVTGPDDSPLYMTPGGVNLA